MSSEAPVQPPQNSMPPVQNDPFPKMIIVCCMISLVLFIFIISVLLYDFLQRQHRTIRPMGIPAGQTFPQEQNPPPAR